VTENPELDVPAAAHSFWMSRSLRFVGGAALAVGLAAGGYGVANATSSGSSTGHKSQPHQPSSSRGNWHRPPGAFGQVASVNGSSSSGACGTAGTAGAFTLTPRKGATVTVNVSSSTSYFEPGSSSSASFADVCVGSTAGAEGKVSSSTVAATKVVILPSGHSRPPGPPGAIGVVASVNGSSSSTACGVAGAAGTFILTTPNKSTVTVDVSTSTKFYDPAVSSPSFANVCVGLAVGAAGKTSSGAIDANLVGVLPAGKGGLPPGVVGKVTAVNGSSTAKTCGTAGASGSFTLSTRHGSPVTVDVTSSTSFIEPGVKSASFADVCVGDFAGATGTKTGSSTVKANLVGVIPPGAHGFPGGKGGWGGHGHHGGPGGWGGQGVLPGGFGAGGWGGPGSTSSLQ
jgi:hypothetical protein